MQSLASVSATTTLAGGGLVLMRSSHHWHGGIMNHKRLRTTDRRWPLGLALVALLLLDGRMVAWSHAQAPTAEDQPPVILRCPRCGLEMRYGPSPPSTVPCPRCARPGVHLLPTTPSTWSASFSNFLAFPLIMVAAAAVLAVAWLILRKVAGPPPPLGRPPEGQEGQPEGGEQEDYRQWREKQRQRGRRGPRD
jgi:hypothetical protein